MLQCDCYLLFNNQLFKKIKAVNDSFNRITPTSWSVNSFYALKTTKEAICRLCQDLKLINWHSKTLIHTVGFCCCAKRKQCSLFHVCMNNTGFGEVMNKCHSSQLSQDVHSDL